MSEVEDDCDEPLIVAAVATALCVNTVFRRRVGYTYTLCVYIPHCSVLSARLAPHSVTLLRASVISSCTTCWTMFHSQVRLTHCCPVWLTEILAVLSSESVMECSTQRWVMGSEYQGPGVSKLVQRYIYIAHLIIKSLMRRGQSINQSINSLITEMSKRTSTCEKHKAVKYT